MEVKKNLVRALALGALLLTLAACGDDKAVYNNFAQCLTDKGVKMYGSFRCPHCLAQKELFGSSFEKVTYVECDKLSRVYDQAACEAQAIESYPTWVFADGTKKLGEQTFEELSEISGCTLPNTTTQK